jgi:hypothetical protein
LSLDKNYASKPSTAFWKRLLLVAFQILLPLACGYVVMQRVQSWPKASLAALLTDFPLHTFIVGFLLTALLNWWLDTALWRQFIPIAHQPPMLRLLRFNIAASSFGFFTPFQMGEYVGKGFYLQGLSKKRNLAATFFFRTAKVYAKIFLGGLGFFLMALLNAWLPVVTGILALASITVCLGYIFQDRIFGLQKFLARWVKNPAVQDLLEHRTPHFRAVTFALACSRILLNTLQFLAILYFLMPTPVLGLLPQVLIFYSIATFIPSVGFLDPIVKSALSLVLVSDGASQTLEVLFATNFVWTFNVGLAALMGSFLHIFRRKQVP